MESFSQDLRDFIALMIEHQVEFMLVGGHAMAVHGVPRYTKDVDLWVSRSEVNARKMLRVLDAFGFSSLGLSEADFLDADAVIQLGYEPNRIDILMGISGVEFFEAYGARVDSTLHGLVVPVIGRLQLIANKRASARPRDLVDADELERRLP